MLFRHFVFLPSKPHRIGPALDQRRNLYWATVRYPTLVLCFFGYRANVTLPTLGQRLGYNHRTTLNHSSNNIGPMLVCPRWPNGFWLSGQCNDTDNGPTFILLSKHIGPLPTLASRRFGYRANVILPTLGQR